MRRALAILAVSLAAAVGAAHRSMQDPAPTGGEKRLIDLKSDLMGPVVPGDSVVFLVGNFAAQHNGAVITCDSAVRYSDMRIEFFGHVLINKNSTYVYGDRAEYDGNRNEARVYSDLIKVVDGDATLYTYRFLFNTESNIGEFSGGGVLTNRDNLLESVRGYYYADTKELIAVGRVEMRNDEYELRGDSVVYDTATDNAYFFDRTHIWNRDGDYLYADRGSYSRADTLYVVTRNGYLLTEKQELWSDSLDYYRARGRAILRRDLQIDDTEHQVLAFGDYGEYRKDPGDALLTQRPAVVSYDPEQGDSLFMRADSMFLYTINRNALRRAAEAEAARAEALARAQAAAAAATPGTSGSTDSPGAASGGSSAGLSAGPDTDRPDRPAGAGIAASATGTEGASVPAAGPDSLAGFDAPAVDPLDTLVGAARKAYLKELDRKARAERKAEAARAKKELLERIAARRQEKTTAQLLAQEERERLRAEARRLKAESKLRARQARAARKGKRLEADSAARPTADSLALDSLAAADSLAARPADSLALDSLARDTLAAASEADSIYRLIRGYRDVRIYRSDFQAVCDSITALSSDSTIHLYIDPVLWNQSNQITSEVMDVYTADRQITHAEFVGSPMMVAQLDTAHYNQVAGKHMTAWFRDNAIYRDDVRGNAQTIYYMQDGEPPVVTGMGVIESGDASYYIEDREVVTIVYRQDPDWRIYPMDKIPPDQELYLKGFKWEGARRPAQADVFDRRIRPSQREATGQLAHPDFPLMRALDARRKLLLEQRRWSDRSEPVDEATVEWMHSLGFEVGQPRSSAVR